MFTNCPDIRHCLSADALILVYEMAPKNKGRKPKKKMLLGLVVTVCCSEDAWGILRE